MYANIKDRVNVICHECNRVFTVQLGTYKRRGVKHLWKCKACLATKVWTDMSPEEQKQRSSSQKLRWNKLSNDEKSKVMKNTRKAQKAYYADPKTKEKLAKRNKDKWASLSAIDRKKELARLDEMRKNYWDSLSDVEKYFKMKKLWDSQTNVGPTEYKFDSDLRENGLVKDINYSWGFNTYPYIHPEYYSKFGKINHVTKEENYPYHNWDFIIHSKSGSGILIDIDGSAHSKNSMLFYRGKNTYTDREKIDYNDSQRPYQIPNNMIAYIVECHSDRIDENTQVLDLKSGKRFSYKELMNIILLSQFTKKELKCLLK